MKGIYFKDGVYVLIDATTDDLGIIYTRRSATIFLYGGRIEICSYSNDDDIYFSVDGITIQTVLESNRSLSKYLTISEAVAHLNAIEANGVDAFLAHYKKSIEFLYAEVKELSQTETLVKELEKIRSLLVSILGLLFNLQCHMSAGLENEKVNTVYQSLIESL